MHKPIVTPLTSVLIGLLLFTTTLGIQRLGLYPEGAIRQIVIKRVMPEFPKETPINSAQGLVIVAVVFDEEGKLSQAEVLEAPHPLIKQAVLDALKLWETERRGSFYGLHQLAGWLSFDCTIKDGKWGIEYTQRTNEDNHLDSDMCIRFLEQTVGHLFTINTNLGRQHTSTRYPIAPALRLLNAGYADDYQY